MKTIILLMSMTLATAAWGQADKPPAKEPEKPAVQKEAAKAPAKMAARKPSPKRLEDARHCLERPTNTEIIKCAEAYL